jgi:multidrug efflux system membrane fusion protein
VTTYIAALSENDGRGVDSTRFDRGAVGRGMSKSKVLLQLVVVLAVAGGAMAAFGKPDDFAKWLSPAKWFGEKAAAQDARGRAGPRTIAVEVATATRQKTPVKVEALGTVTTMASVAVKTRLDNEIVGIHFSDGASVKQGDILVTLDPRAIEAQIAQAEGTLARDQAQLDGAERDLRRNTDLLTKGAGPQLNVENSKTQADAFRAAIKADLAALENLKVQLSYCTIRAPISGRISQAAVKVGNFVRSADTFPIATINQIAPIYVTFTVPQGSLPQLREALAEGDAPVEATVPGEEQHARGSVAMIENTVDPTTGMATVRAVMPNNDELLWPGTLVSVAATVRVEDDIVVPSDAVQVRQQGSFVYVVRDNVATVRPVTVAWVIGDDTVIGSGLDDGDVVVTDGHLQLTNGARVAIHAPKGGTAAIVQSGGG